MATIDHHHSKLPAGDGPGSDVQATKPLWARITHGHHWRSKAEEFDGVKTGMWLFLATEVLLFAGLFCAYAIFRYFYPQAFANGSGYLDWRFGGLNTIVLLISSYTMAVSIHYAQTNKQLRMQINLIVTLICGAAFLFIKLTFEYAPKWAAGKRPGVLFDYPFAKDPNEPLWWSIYYCATGIHALHVVIGMVMIAFVLRRSLKGMYGPGHYTGIEMAGLYWHLVDLIWIFLFPLLYLIH
jgi:cytochrome c oxidase subunit III